MKTRQPKIIIWLRDLMADKEIEHRIAVIHRYNQMLESQLRSGKFNYENKQTIHQ